MTDALAQSKAALRLQLRSRLQRLGAAEREAAARSLCNRLRVQSQWKRAGSILFFAPLADEPDIWPLVATALAEAKCVALPSFVAGTNSYAARRILDPMRDLVSGKFGIREPSELSPEMELNQLDLVLVPGLAFDPHGRRLGRGKGFYDRLLRFVCGAKCGVAFDEQIVDAVPVGPLDIPLNCILTPARWIET